MPVTTRQNKKGKKGGAVFRFCTKASVYTLLVWIVNYSNSSQYGGNSYNVMNNGLGKAMDSRTLRLLAEAYEEDIEQDGPIVYDEEDIEQDGPAVYEEAIEQDGPAVYEEAIEQDGPVVHEEDIEQDGPVVHEEDIEQDGPVVHEEDIEQDGPVVHEEDIEQDGPVVHEEDIEEDGETTGVVGSEEQVVQKAPSLSSLEEEVVQKAPKNSAEEGKVEHRDDEYAQVQSPYKNREQKIKEYYEKRKIDVHDNFKPTITYNFEEALKRCIAFDARIHDRDQDCLNVGSYPEGYHEPQMELEKMLNAKKPKQEGYLRMHQNYFRNVPLIDDIDYNKKQKGPYFEREYGRLDLSPARPRTTAVTRNVERKINKPKVQEVEEVKGKKKKKRRFCCF
ncbi:Uncharacterized protein PCOAH_00006260 [Plasmodium coatneyi]|uniref:Uncharacterized protein n=1 Tax=Plasmodium coatneyi TaxID=208452 RepID=A0A1B1DTR8_9APIC|nr:Uncharacterized protein PCOAH_00006260 [Plasmodium coatneyi]ANQ06152.1 Uncharacterized protein PCOAH_00006260 [Plasmodium coatneyi]